MLFAPFQIEVTGGAQPVPIQSGSHTKDHNRVGPGFRASRDRRSESRFQAIDLSVISTSVQVCTSAHLVMYGGKLLWQDFGIVEVRCDESKNE
jgi:hypothetical protein